MLGAVFHTKIYHGYKGRTAERYNASAGTILTRSAPTNLLLPQVGFSSSFVLSSIPHALVEFFFTDDIDLGHAISSVGTASITFRRRSLWDSASVAPPLLLPAVVAKQQKSEHVTISCFIRIGLLITMRSYSMGAAETNGLRNSLCRVHVGVEEQDKESWAEANPGSANVSVYLQSFLQQKTFWIGRRQELLHGSQLSLVCVYEERYGFHGI